MCKLICCSLSLGDVLNPLVGRRIALFHLCHLPAFLLSFFSFPFLFIPGSPPTPHTQDVIIYRFTPFSGNEISLLGTFVSYVMFQPESSELFKLFSPVIIICFEFYGVRIIKIEVQSLDTKVSGTHTHTPPQPSRELLLLSQLQNVPGDGDFLASAL